MSKLTSSPWKVGLISWIGATFIRVLGMTVRFELVDEAGVARAGGKDVEGVLLWAGWHNRILLMPVVYKKFLHARAGAVLTSRSGDGAIIAAVMKRFGVGAVRGSSSKGGSQALRELTAWVEEDQDVMITPDGPRGPKEKVQPGIVALASRTDAQILPIKLEYEKKWELKTWDAFQIPKPFSKAKVTLGKPYTLADDLKDEAFTSAQESLESQLS